MIPAGWFTREISGRHVLLVLCAFFGVMFAVNGVFVYLALETFSGGDTSDPYRKGLHYNDMLAAEARQLERGWHSDVAYDEKAKELRVSLLDKAEEPLSGLRIAVRLSRPATDKEDRHLLLKEVSQGVYAASVDLAPGAWVLALASRKANEGRDGAFRVKERLYVSEQP